MTLIKLLTETYLRRKLLDKQNKITIQKNTIITPAALEYLKSHCMEVEYLDTPSDEKNKPEHMTHGRKNQFICKDDPIITLRGKLDTLQALTVCFQLKFMEVGTGNEKLQDDLEEILTLLRLLMKAEVLDEEIKDVTGLFGYSWEELHSMSHNPDKYFNTPHTRVSKNMKPECIMLNYFRTQVRETELAAVKALYPYRSDIIKILNRLSSAVYVLFLSFLSVDTYSSLTKR